MTLADMMLMILEISSKSGICEELFLTVNQLNLKSALHPVPFGCIRFLFFFPYSAVKFLCFILISSGYAEMYFLVRLDTK